MIEDIKKAMIFEFKMTYQGLMKYFLGKQIKQSSGQIFISKEKYAKDLLKKFNILYCELLSTATTTNKKLSKYDGKDKVDGSTYQSLISSLIYLTNTRPDIVLVVSIVTQFMSEPYKPHFTVVKRIFMCIKRHKELWSLYKIKKE